MDETRNLDLNPEPLPGVPDGALLRLSGKGGHAVVRMLQETVQPLLAKGTKNLLFDCGRLEFFNSAAFGYLTNLSDALRAAGGRVALCRVPLKVQVAFEVMGLKDFFVFFEDESEAALFFQKSAAPEEDRLPQSQPPLEAAPPEGEPESAPAPAGYSLPSWLEDVDKPGPPPLDHLRWSALLQTVLRRLGPQSLAGIPRRAIVPADSPPSIVARAILRGLQTPEDLLGLFDEETLERICRLFRLPGSGDQEERSKALIEFVHRTDTVSLARFMEEGPLKPAPASPEKALDMTHDSLLGAIQRCPFPKSVKTERSGRDLLSKHLAKTFGRSQITPGRTLGRHLTPKVDLDVRNRFGILVRLAKSVLGKKPSEVKNVENLLGKVVLLAGIYGRGNLYVVLLGEVPKSRGSAVGELRAWMDGAGARTIQRS